MAVVFMLGGCISVRPDLPDSYPKRHKPGQAGAASETPTPTKLALGLTRSQVNAMYGLPVRINETPNGDQSVYRQTCRYSRDLYQENVFVYFREGVVVDFQKLGCIN